jgi:signal transduction histidine kinase
MKIETSGRRALVSWITVATLVLLCAVLGALQYRWIGEVSVAERERLRGSLQGSLNRLSLGFNTEIANACATVSARPFPPGALPDAEEYAARFLAWREAAAHEDLFRTFAIAAPTDGRLTLRRLDQKTGVFEPFEWPDSWSRLRERLEARLVRDQRDGRPGPPWGEDGLLIEIPQFGPPPAGPPVGRFGRPEAAWLVLELNLDTVRHHLLPDLLKRHLGAEGTNEYLVEVVSKGDEPAIIFQSDPEHRGSLRNTADAAVSLFDIQLEQVFRRSEMRGGREGGPPRGPSPDRGRWLMYARHRAGSLEAVVAQTRLRNLAVMSGVLLLLIATMVALIRYTRRAQKLAELQMDFVAGVSHELRTPLAVIRTAAYNLRGKLANNPPQVEKYGALIQEESERLTELVEQVLRFASAKAGKAAQSTEPVSIESVVAESLASARNLIEESGCEVERHVDPDLPLILGDPVALKHAIQNLLSNAAKYGAEGGRWIGVFAERDGSGGVLIRVADRGPGIPADEKESVFEPFFRGRRAMENQIHGTGLGLNLVKGIVEAHGGTVGVESAPGKGAEFTIRIPAAPVEYQDELKDTAGRG